MPRKLEHPDSWLHVARIRAGYKTVRSLAERLGVALSQVVEWGRGRQRPMWKHVLQLADVFVVAIEEVITGVWRESLGDPCPCGCGGVKVIPDDPTARKLLIEVPCTAVGCKKSSIHTQGNVRFHFRFCRSHAQQHWRRKRGIKPATFECVGYNDHHTRRWAEECSLRFELLPYQIRHREKQYRTRRHRFRPEDQQRTRFKRRQPAFIDRKKKRLRCGLCASAAMVAALTEERIKKLTDEPIKSRSDRRLLLAEYIHKINPKLLEVAATAPKNPERSDEARRQLAMSNIVKAWPDPENLPKVPRLWVCLHCEKITFDSKRPTKFHRACWRAWLKTPEGVAYQRTKGHKPSLGETQPLGYMSEKSLRVHLFRAIQYYFTGKTSEDIAYQAGDLTSQAIEHSIKSLIADLPSPEFVQKRFRRSIELLLERSGIASEPAPSASAVHD